MKRIVAPKVFDSCLSQKYGTYSNNEVKVYAVIGDKGGQIALCHSRGVSKP